MYISVLSLSPPAIIAVLFTVSVESVGSVATASVAAASTVGPPVALLVCPAFLKKYRLMTMSSVYISEFRSKCWSALLIHKRNVEWLTVTFLSRNRIGKRGLTLK